MLVFLSIRKQASLAELVDNNGIDGNSSNTPLRRCSEGTDYFCQISLRQSFASFNKLLNQGGLALDSAPTLLHEMPSDESVITYPEPVHTASSHSAGNSSAERPGSRTPARRVQWASAVDEDEQEHARRRHAELSVHSLDEAGVNVSPLIALIQLRLTISPVASARRIQDARQRIRAAQRLVITGTDDSCGGNAAKAPN
jgi:hypothetical protein